MDRNMGDSLYFQPTTILDLGLTGSQYRTMPGQLLRNISSMMEGGGGTRALGTESFSIITDLDD